MPTTIAVGARTTNKNPSTRPAPSSSSPDPISTPVAASSAIAAIAAARWMSHVRTPETCRAAISVRPWRPIVITCATSVSGAASWNVIEIRIRTSSQP